MRSILLSLFVFFLAIDGCRCDAAGPSAGPGGPGGLVGQKKGKRRAPEEVPEDADIPEDPAEDTYKSRIKDYKKTSNDRAHNHVKWLRDSVCTLRGGGLRGKEALSQLRKDVRAAVDNQIESGQAGNYWPNNLVRKNFIAAMKNIITKEGASRGIFLPVKKITELKQWKNALGEKRVAELRDQARVELDTEARVMPENLKPGTAAYDRYKKNEYQKMYARFKKLVKAAYNRHRKAAAPFPAEAGAAGGGGAAALAGSSAAPAMSAAVAMASAMALGVSTPASAAAVPRAAGAGPAS